MGRQMKPILSRKCRSEKDDSNGVSGNKIRATLVAHEVRGIICQNFDRCINGQRWIFPTAICRAIENVHGDISYVLIEGQR